MPSPTISSSRQTSVTPLPPCRKIWSRTIWFHIAVGAAAKNGRQISAAVNSTADQHLQGGSRKRRMSSNQPRTIRTVTTPQILIVTANPSSAPAAKALPRGNELALATGSSRRIASSRAVVAGLSSNVDVIGIDGWVEHGITECAEQGGNQADGPEDSPDQDSVQRAEQHPRYSCGGETVRVAGELRTQGRKRCQQQRHAWRMEQQEVR